MKILFHISTLQKQAVNKLLEYLKTFILNTSAQYVDVVRILISKLVPSTRMINGLRSCQKQDKDKAEKNAVVSKILSKHREKTCCCCWQSNFCRSFRSPVLEPPEMRFFLI